MMIVFVKLNFFIHFCALIRLHCDGSLHWMHFICIFIVLRIHFLLKSCVWINDLVILDSWSIDHVPCTEDIRILWLPHVTVMLDLIIWNFKRVVLNLINLFIIRFYKRVFYHVLIFSGWSFLSNLLLRLSFSNDFYPKYIQMSILLLYFPSHNPSSSFI